MARPGRRPNITPELTAEIVKKIKNGAFPTVAASSSGVGDSTFMRWLQRGKRKNSKKVYRDFREAIDEARAKACHDAETRVFSKEPLEWLRRGPGRSRWGDKTEIEISGNQRKPLRIDDAGPFSVVELAQSQVILADLGIVPPLAEEAEKALIAFGEEVTDDADEEDRQEITGTPEWMKRRATAGRRHSAKKKKKDDGSVKNPNAT